MIITHHNYLQVDYCQHDWDMFYVGDEVEVGQQTRKTIGKIIYICDDYFKVIDGQNRERYCFLDDKSIKSIRKVEKQ